jgi:ankyrin repeat protein
MSFGWLPNPLIIRIAGYLDQHDLSVLARVNRHLRRILLIYLYQLDFKQGSFLALHHYCRNGYINGLVDLFISINTMPRAYQLSWDGKLAPFLKHSNMILFGHEEGINPMHEAIENGHRDVVDFLLRRGFNANCRQGGFTGLEVAAGKGHLEIVKVLLEAGADITRGSGFGGALWSAVYHDQEHVAAFLLTELKTRRAAGKENDPPAMLTIRRALDSAVRSKNTRMVEMLLEEVGPVDFEGDLGETPLLVAVWSKTVDVVRILLRKGADPNKDLAQWPRPLTVAAQRGLVDITGALLDAGADPEALDGTGRTPLSHAAEEGHVEVVRLLLRYGADISLRDSGRRWSALEWAISEKKFKVVDILRPLYAETGDALAS